MVYLDAHTTHALNLPMNKPFQISRRSFLKTASVAAAATGLPLWFLERELGSRAGRKSAGPQ